MCDVHLLRRQLGAGLFCAKHGVAEPLREPVDGLARAVEVEPEPALVERALGGLPGEIELLTQPIEQCHWCTLPLEGDCRTVRAARLTRLHVAVPREGGRERQRPPEWGAFVDERS